MALPFVDEVKELSDQFATAFVAVEVDVLQNRTVVFDKSVARGNLAPDREDVIPAGTILRVKVAKTGQELQGDQRRLGA